MRDHGDRQRPAWPVDTRLAMSDLFEMIEAFEKNPNGYSPEMREALSNDPYGRHHAAQLEAAAGREKPKRRGR